MTLETGAPTFLEGTHSATHDVNSPTALSFTIYCRKTTHQCFALILTTSLGSPLRSTIKYPSCQRSAVTTFLGSLESSAAPSGTPVEENVPHNAKHIRSAYLRKCSGDFSERTV
ncbi:uncharacterized protein LOC116847440 [Odontomachus brunneus]|uniref:uncharacterized protein LOC116847440 n=1 Tax=Odontomachus brunneus TaxID=486640 RepID=UPI0013F2AA71|nr:uncharacterized protein LOC116847440 [Odontomachus brunneus]